MNEQECLSKMVAPGTKRPGKYRQGVIQIWVTRACDKSCYHCTQASNLAGKPEFITPEQFEVACKSLINYWGVVGMFGGNPAVHPKFEQLCEILRHYIPWEQRGLWSNNPLGKGATMRRTFNPAVSNLNVHLDAKAYEEFKTDWPECNPVGLREDSRHSPVHLAMKDVLWRECTNSQHRAEDAGALFFVECQECGGTRKVYDEDRAWELISNCDINHHWSAMIGVFRGQVRAWFCEVAGAQAMLHQHEPDYPDTGIPLPSWEDHRQESASRNLNVPPWWQLDMTFFLDQVRKHCHECAVPLRGYGELAQATRGTEYTSATHADIYRPKRLGREVKIVTTVEELRAGAVARATDYLGNAKR